jgi:hypothetical protein
MSLYRQSKHFPVIGGREEPVIVVLKAKYLLLVLKPIAAYQTTYYQSH